jgi:hypothetical protein
VSQKLKHHLLKLLGHGIYIAVGTAGTTTAVYAFLIFYDLAFRFTISGAHVVALVAGAVVFFALYDHVAHDVRKSINFVRNQRITKYFVRNAPSYISGAYATCLFAIILVSSGDQLKQSESWQPPEASQSTPKTAEPAAQHDSKGESEDSKIVDAKADSERAVAVPGNMIEKPEVIVLVPLPRPRNVLCEFDSERIGSQKQTTNQERDIKLAECQKELAKHPPKTDIGGPGEPPLPRPRPKLPLD